MCFSSPRGGGQFQLPAPPPPPDPPPEPPTVEDPEVAAALERNRAQALAAEGRTSTVLTKGVDLGTSSSEKKTLTGV